MTDEVVCEHLPPVILLVLVLMQKWLPGAPFTKEISMIMAWISNYHPALVLNVITNFMP